MSEYRSFLTSLFKEYAKQTFITHSISIALISQLIFFWHFSM